MRMINLREHSIPPYYEIILVFAQYLVMTMSWTVQIIRLIHWHDKVSSGWASADQYFVIVTGYDGSRFVICLKHKMSNRKTSGQLHCLRACISKIIANTWIYQGLLKALIFRLKFEFAPTITAPKERKNSVVQGLMFALLNNVYRYID